MPVVTRKVVFQAVRAKFATPAQRKALSQRLGKSWSYASTDVLAQAVGLQGKPRSSVKGATRAKSTTQQHGFARSFASENAAKNLSENETKRALIKGRLVRSVKKAITAKEKELRRKLDPKEKKTVAAKAFGAEVKAIKSGQPESKPLRGNRAKAQKIEKRIADTKADIEATKTEIKKLRDNAGGHSHSVGQAKIRLKQQKERLLFFERSHPDRAKQIAALEAEGTPPTQPKSSFALTPPPGVSVADHRAALRRKYGAETGDRSEGLARKEQQRSEVARGDGGDRSRVRGVADRVAELPARGRVSDDIPFGNSTTATKPPAKRLDGALNSQQKKTIAAHLRKVESGTASSVPLRALQDSDGQHWLEMRSSSGRVGAVPIDGQGRKDNDRALHSEEWEKKAKAMSMIARFPVAKEEAKTVEAEVMPTETGGKKPSVTGKVEGAIKSDVNQEARQNFEAAIKKDPALRKYLELSTGKKQSDKAMRAAIGVDQNELIKLGWKLRKLLGITPMDSAKGALARLYGVEESSNRSKSPTTTRGTKNKPWAGNDAPLALPPKAQMVRGRSID